jgi:hypothetical protein
MTTHGQFACGEGPNMEIVDLFYLIQAKHISETLDHIYVFGGGFHKNGYAVTEDRDCSENTEKSKKECANWVYNMPFRFEVDNYSSDYHSNTLDDISNYMNNSSSNVHVFVAVSVATM